MLLYEQSTWWQVVLHCVCNSVICTMYVYYCTTRSHCAINYMQEASLARLLAVSKVDITF